MTEELNSGGPDKFKLLYDAMASDEVFSQVVPDNFDAFINEYKDPNKMRTLYRALKDDEVFSQVVPATENEAIIEFGLGKPSPTPQSGSGLGTQKNVGQTPMVPQEPSMPAPSSAPQYLSPEEFGRVEQLPREEVIQTQTVIKPAPTPQQIEPFKDPNVQIALRAELQKKKAQESKDLSESFKGNLLGAMYNSVANSFTKYSEDILYNVSTVMTSLYPELVEGGEQMTSEQRMAEVDTALKNLGKKDSKTGERVGIKETLDDMIKSKGTTDQFIERTKKEGGIIAEGILGLGESSFQMITPSQSGFFVGTFADAHKEIRKEMPDASPVVQFLYSAAQGTAAMLLEKRGFSNLIQNKSVMKNLTGKIVNEIKNMGVKMTPEVLESTAAKLVNGFLAEAETGGTQFLVEESIKQITDALQGEEDSFEFEGWQKFTGNFFRAAASEGVGGFVMKSLGEAASAIKSPADKQKASQDKQQVDEMMNDLSNPNVSPEAKQAISKKVDEKAEAILETYATEQSKIEGLSEEGKKEFTSLSEQATSMEAVIADPNVSDATKQAVQSDLEETNKKIEAILASAKESPVTEQPTTNSQVNLDAIKYEIDRERKSLEEDIKFEEDYIAQRKKKGSLGKVKDWFLTEEWFPKKDKFLNSKKENLNLLNNDPKKYFELKLKEQMEWSEKNPDDSNDFLTSYYSGLIDKLNSTPNPLANVDSVIQAIDDGIQDRTFDANRFFEIIDTIPDGYVPDKYIVGNESVPRNYPEKQLAEAYFKAKADGSNPELVQAVEELLTPTQQQPTETAQPKPTAELSSQEIADKKAETQRTREDISEEGLQELNQGKSTDSEIEGQNIGSFKKVWGYLRGKYSGNIDLLIDFVANPSDYLLELNKVLAGVKVSKFGKAYSSFIEALEKQVDDINKKLDERVNKGIRENYPKAAMDKLIAERDNKKSENNKVLEEAKKLSDKYDAEIAAKESQTQPKTPTPSIEAQVAEIKSKPLTRIEGAGMGANQAVGTFVSTEPENRYAAQFPDAEVQSMEVDIKNPFVTEDTNLIDYRNEMINRRKGELDETDFTEVEIPSGEFTIDDLSDSGIEKVAAMVTEEMKAKGYDSIYFPQTDTQEGELVVFDREKVRRKGEAATTTEQAPTTESQTTKTAPVSEAKAEIEKRLKEEIISLEKDLKAIKFKDGNTLGKMFPNWSVEAATFIREQFKNAVTKEEYDKAVRYEALINFFDIVVENELKKQTPQQDATQTRNQQQSNQQQREGATRQQQGQQEDRANQEGNVAQGEAEAGGGNRVAEGGTEQEVSADTKQQIEAFGVAPEMVETVNSVILQVFDNLKKSGLTAAKNVGEWIGIGKGEEKPYSLKINGQDVQVRNVSPEVVNGFYSNTEKALSQVKQEKMSGNQWATQLLSRGANKEEMQFTGLEAFLKENASKPISKSDIDNFLKDNRIEIVEVVGSENEGNLPASSMRSTITSLQLEGERSNYKEILVTLPTQAEKAKAIDTGEGTWVIQYPDNSTSFVEYRSKEFAEKAIEEGIKNKGGMKRRNEYRSTHFDVPNILVHLRMNTRTDVDGNKVLFLEEVQSDWGQEGKKKGFADEAKERLYNERNKIIDDWRSTSTSLSKEEKERLNELESLASPAYLTDETYNELKSLRIKVRDGQNTAEKRIIELNAELGLDKYSTQQQYFASKTPAAPFVMDTNAWTKLGLKFALKEAVAQGADKIAWTTGEQQNERYDLSKSVEEIQYKKNSNGLYRIEIEFTNGDGQTGNVEERELEATVGKEIAQKIIETSTDSFQSIEGEGLKVGGKGMIDSYGSPSERSKKDNLTIKKEGELFAVKDEKGKTIRTFKQENEANKFKENYGLGIVGNVAKSLFKQVPATIEIKTATKGGESDMTNYKNGEYQENSTQYSIDVTPELKASVEGGQPLFKGSDAQYRIENGKNLVEAISDFNGSPRAVVAITHEIMHPTVVAIIDGAAQGNEIGAKHTQTIVDEYNKANPGSKVTVDQLIADNEVFKNGITSKQYRSVQEFIAESWEKYHTEGGKGFSKAFQEVLEQITKAFKAVYQSISGTQLTPELRKMFDEILGKDQTQALDKESGTIQLTPEQQTRVATRELLSDVSDWNKLGRKEKRSDSARKEAERLKAEAKSVGLTLETKAIKSGLRLVATNADGQVMTVDKVNKVMNPKRVVWSDANYAVQETTDANGNRVVEFYDAKTGDQIRSNSKEGAKAKEAYYEGNIQKFLGKDKPIDIDSLLDYYGMNEDGFNRAVLEAVAESDNAFEIAANYQNFVNHDADLVDTKYDPTYELAQLVGQVSEEDFIKYFDKNWLNKNSKWIDPNYKGDSIDTRILSWIETENKFAESDFAATLRGKDSSEILKEISDLVQAYPDGPQSIKPTKEGGLLPLASQKFRDITGKPLNPVTAYEFNEMFNRYADNQAFGFASKVAWEDLSPQQKQEIIDEQTRPVEDEFFFEGSDFENQSELFAENEQDQEGAEEFPTEGQRDEIEEDGFAMPTDEEMAAKSEEIQTDLQKAIQDVKDKFGDLFNQNMGIIYDPKVEARKLYNFHVALVNLAKTAIRSGINTAADFAKTLGKRLDKFTERAFNDAMNDLNGDPMIINSEQDMLNAEYQRVAESYAKQREDAKKLKKPFLKRFIEGVNAGWFDANYVAKKLLSDVGGFEAIKFKNLLGGASSKAKTQFETFKREIFGGLTSAEKKLLNDIIQARTVISIDNRYDAKGKPRIKHPGDTNKESQAIFLGQIEKSQPKLFNKLIDRSNKYFEAQRELLDERLKEGRISVEQYQGMVNNDYSKRVFLDYLLDDVESGSGLTSGGQGSVGRSDIKSLSDGDVNSLFHNAEWLLASNVLATSRSIFHNRANRSLYEIAKADPNNGFIEIQNPNGFNKETGQPTYKDPRSDQRQVQFFENGVRKSMLVTREFGESWNNNNPLLAPQYANAIRIVSGGVMKRLFATGINPLFALSNFPRDIAHSLFFTNAYSPNFPVALAQISTDLARTAKDAWKFNRTKDKNGRYYKYIMQGGGMDFLSTQGLPFEQQALLQSSAKEAMDAVGKVLGYINNSSEIWVRLAIREREAKKLTAKFARDNGRMPNTSEKESIESSATDVSRSQMDFSQGGRWAKAMDNLIPYLNASLQGLRVSVRYARENPKVFSYKVAQALAISAALAAYNMRFKDDYDDLEDEEKNRNFIIMLDFVKTVDGKKRRAYLRIPKNQSSQWIFAMGEIMGESMQAKEFRPRKGASTLQTLMPPYDPRNIPLIDALNTYETGYDRFREKYVYDKDYKGEAWAEYYENKTPWLWRDIGKQFGLSPIRLKAAVGKMTADPDNNMIWVAVTEGYDKLIKSVPEDEQKSINDMAIESMEQLLTPAQRKFLAYTNPDSKAKSIRELEASEATKVKLQNDTVKNYVNKYINNEMSEVDARSEFTEWFNTQPKDSVNTKRLKTRFENSIQFKDVDNVFYRMGQTDYPKVKAKILFYAYLKAKDKDAREVLLFQAKSNPNVPKDKSSEFWKEFERLKALGKE
jgi:hypothetical protein